MLPVVTSSRFMNATVWCGDGTTRDSVTVRNGLIVNDDAPVDEVIDCNDGFLCAGFADGHAHPLFGGLEREFAPVRDAASWPEVVSAVRQWAEDHPDAQWVRGEGFDPSLAERGEFHAAWLDEAVPDRPVALRAMDYHTMWVNSEALRRVGYLPGVQQPDDGEIVLLPDGSPMGTLREWGAWRPIQDQFGPLSGSTAMEALRAASEVYASSGVTWVQDAWVEPDMVEAWIGALNSGILRIRVNLGLWADPNAWRDQLTGFTASRDLIEAQSSDLLSCNAVKFFADGIIEAGTGALSEPYCDCPHSKGMPVWEPDELAEAITAIDALGFDAHIHAIGDAAVRIALDAMEIAIRANGERKRNFVIAHLQLVDPSDIPRFAELGITANFEPYWAKQDDDQTVLVLPRLGNERSNRQYQMRTFLMHGATVSFGSDWPVTTAYPLAGIATAVSRQISCDAPSWMPEECLSVESALAAYTSGTAMQAGRDNAGYVLPGYVADLVLLENDPRTVEACDIASIRVCGTWLHGDRTFGG